MEPLLTLSPTPRMRQLMERCVATRRAIGAADTGPVHAFAVPGRIEVFGKHTDYAGGRSLLVAVERGFVVLSTERPDGRVRITDAVSGETVDLDGGVIPERPLWARYPATVVRRLNRNFPDAQGGAEIVFASDLPPASGLSSSSALVVATYLAMDGVRRVSETTVYRRHIRSVDDLAGYLGAVENGFAYAGLSGEPGVGTMGGSEDHTAILAARPNQLVQYSFAPVTFEATVAMPASHTFVVGVSGVHAEKAGAALAQYNRLAIQVRRLADLWRVWSGRDDATLAAALRSDPGAAQRLRAIADERAEPGERASLLVRLEQFVTESEELIPGAAAAIARGDLVAFGSYVKRSQALAERALENTVPETAALIQTARQLGATAVSAFGAGFGGSVWALVAKTDAATFTAAWRDGYVERCPARQPQCVFFETSAGPPACRLIGSPVITQMNPRPQPNI